MKAPLAQFAYEERDDPLSAPLGDFRLARTTFQISAACVGSTQSNLSGILNFAAEYMRTQRS